MRTVRNITFAVDPGHQHSQSLPEKTEIRAVSLYGPVSSIRLIYLQQSNR
jgi:hypothetical protein